MTLLQLQQRVKTGEGPNTLVYGPFVTEWIEARHVASLADAGTPPYVPTNRKPEAMDYEIFGNEVQHIEVILGPGDMVVGEAGALMHMSPKIEMETVHGDPSAPETGLFGKVMSAGKRALTGDSFFLTAFKNPGNTHERVAFGAPCPGRIVTFHLEEFGGEVLCLKDCFLCAARGVHVTTAFQKKIAVGLFTADGFVLQKFSGDGIVVLHAGGILVRRTLAAEESLIVDIGCVVALQPTVQYDVQLVEGIKNSFFPDEGLYFAMLTGPGEVWMQSVPFSRLAGRVLANAPRKGGRGEGFFGLGKKPENEP
jgi:uncharacterized protein (AIM24 family)